MVKISFFFYRLCLLLRVPLMERETYRCFQHTLKVKWHVQVDVELQEMERGTCLALSLGHITSLSVLSAIGKDLFSLDSCIDRVLHSDDLSSWEADNEPLY